MPLFLKPVTHPIKRFDLVKGLFDLLEFLPHPLNVTVDCTVIDINLIVTGGIHQSIAAFDHTGARGERLQDQELGDGERDSRRGEAAIPASMAVLDITSTGSRRQHMLV